MAKQTMTAQEVVALRSDLGWTQLTLSQALGVTVRTIQHWESNTGAAPSPIYVSVMQRLRQRLEHAKRTKQLAEFQKELESQLPKVLFGIGLAAIFIFLFQED